MRCSNIKKYEHPQTNLMQGIVGLFSNQIGTVPSEGCKNYSAFEANLTFLYDPIYALIEIMPSEYLWEWLGGQLRSPPRFNNLKQQNFETVINLIKIQLWQQKQLI
jgi:hypothetical protein